MTFDADGYAADSLANQQEAMAGPLETAMRSERLAIGTAGRIQLDAGHWEPMIQLAPSRDLADEQLVITATLVSGTGTLTPLRFEPFSERDGWLTLFVPSGLAGRRTATISEIDIQARLGGRLLSLADARTLVAVRVVEGMFARLLHVVSVEQMRLRRQARLVSRAATLGGARGFMLDRYGQELGVPRLTDRLVVRRGEIETEAINGGEDDVGYRRRLGIYRPWFAAGQRAVKEALNGTATVPGPLQQIGAPGTFDVFERDNPLYSGLRIVSVAADATAAEAQRARFFAYLRASILIDPAVATPAGRALPQTARTVQNALRQRLRNGLIFTDPNKRSMAPHLALALDRLIAFIRACGANDQLTVRRAQDDSGGSRFELGLAAEMSRVPGAALTAVRGTLTSATRRASLAPQHQAIAKLLDKEDVSESTGAWLFRALGFNTVDIVSSSVLVVSHLSMGTLTVEGPATGTLATAATGLRYAAVMASDAAGLGMALANALKGGDAGWPAGGPPWTLLPMAQLAAHIDGLKECEAALAAAASQGLTITTSAPDVPRFIEAVKRYPAGTVAVLSLDPVFVAALKSGDAAALSRWTTIAEQLGSNGAASLGLFGSSSGAAVLVVSAHGLPLIGSNVGARRSTGYFWDVMLASDTAAGQCSPSGTETVLRASAPGIYAIHCLASARIGSTDPFEYRVDLPPGSTIDIGQYEMLMNILGRCYPVAIEVNTWNLRRSHVVLDSANPVPLTPHQSRSFRRWQDLRFVGVDLSQPVS